MINGIYKRFLKINTFWWVRRDMLGRQLHGSKSCCGCHCHNMQRSVRFKPWFNWRSRHLTTLGKKIIHSVLKKYRPQKWSVKITVLVFWNGRCDWWEWTQELNENWPKIWSYNVSSAQQGQILIEANVISRKLVDFDKLPFSLKLDSLSKIRFFVFVEF